ncbi:uncharacterized protein LACBIDRAFT_305960 [Laccaria bicolor S238N-H82]|uniref:Predicted protein n=1 Tax=Laccaria bicolor (strain S238N-H82 / ATCC MYA-4686) TaxID=486041 RepID=B0CSC8_LACBS|nr:uncharacterized protein LACBIDRAFT_305960 [Laccaria bicolor S238N-H82]EDR14284.1 predicted protein [Laccaria bicolor S238N-H82]|eukprot:XP_001874843.1 predicted protein [Laccaria bicolor S238N-H82]
MCKWRQVTNVYSCGHQYNMADQMVWTPTPRLKREVYPVDYRSIARIGIANSAQHIHKIVDRTAPLPAGNSTFSESTVEFVTDKGVGIASRQFPEQYQRTLGEKCPGCVEAARR